MSSKLRGFVLICLALVFVMALVIPAGKNRIMGLLSGDISRTDFRTNHTDETKFIQMEKATDLRQLTIYEDDRVKIAIGYDQFMALLDSNPIQSLSISNADVEKMKAAFKTGSLPNNVYSLSEIVSGQLKLGKASIYDKRSSADVLSIIMHHENAICGPVCGRGSITFYFPNGTLLYKGPMWNF